jgi:hypothetical protein
VSVLLASSVHGTFYGIWATDVETNEVNSVNVLVDNSLASAGGTSQVVGLYATGGGMPAPDYVQTLRASNVVVRSIGLGVKASVYSVGAILRIRDSNLICYMADVNTGYGVKLSGAPSTAYIASSTIQGASVDLDQSNPGNPGTTNFYLTSTNLVNRNANAKTFLFQKNIPQYVWSDPGTLVGIDGPMYMRYGTSASTFTESEIVLVAGGVAQFLSIKCQTPPSGIVQAFSWVLRKNGVDTALAVALTGAQTFDLQSTISVTYQPGEFMSLKWVSMTSNISDCTASVYVY